jgi:hypothetical protein
MINLVTNIMDNVLKDLIFHLPQRVDATPLSVFSVQYVKESIALAKSIEVQQEQNLFPPGIILLKDYMYRKQLSHYSITQGFQRRQYNAKNIQDCSN